MDSLMKHKIPTALGVVVLVVGAVVGVLFLQRKTSFSPRAVPEFTPQNLTVTNVTDNSFTMSWLTDQPTGGFLHYGANEADLDSTQGDDRDVLTGSVGSFETHHVTVRGLQPQTTYYVRIGSGDTGQLYDNNGSAYEVTTGSAVGAPPPADTAYGQVETVAGTPAEGAIVYVTLPGVIPQSGLVKESGQWAVSLSTAFASDLKGYGTYDADNEKVTLLVMAGVETQATAVTTTGNDQPVPLITLGGIFDFTDGGEQAAGGKAAETRDPVVSKFDLSPLEGVPVATSELTILNPSADSEAVNTQRPEFRGTAPAGATLTITVNSSQPLIGTVAANETNEWSWTPPEDLAAGEHEMTVTYTDAEGILQTLSRSFTVYAATESDLPAFTSTPSATPVPSPIPTATPTPSPSPSPAPTPTPVATDGGRVIMPPADSEVPTAGVAAPTLLLLLMGTGMIGLGILFWKQFAIYD